MSKCRDGTSHAAVAGSLYRTPAGGRVSPLTTPDDAVPRRRRARIATRFEMGGLAGKPARGLSCAAAARLHWSALQLLGTGDVRVARV